MNSTWTSSIINGLRSAIAGKDAEIARLRAEIERKDAALRTCVIGMKHARIFISSREKMAPVGQELFDEDIAEAETAIAKEPSNGSL
jgi:hypothetical protein